MTDEKHILKNEIREYIYVIHFDWIKPEIISDIVNPSKIDATDWLKSRDNPETVLRQSTFRNFPI